MVSKYNIIFNFLAIKNRHDEIAEYLIEKGANIEVENSFHETPLFTGKYIYLKNK